MVDDVRRLIDYASNGESRRDRTHDSATQIKISLVCTNLACIVNLLGLRDERGHCKARTIRYLHQLGSYSTAKWCKPLLMQRCRC